MKARARPLNREQTAWLVSEETREYILLSSCIGERDRILAYHLAVFEGLALCEMCCEGHA